MMIRQLLFLTLFTLVIAFPGCNRKKENTMMTEAVQLMVLDPAHFHASLVQKEMYPGMDTNVYVFAPKGIGLDDYIQRVESYNSRNESPTSWNLSLYSESDFLEEMVEKRPGNLVVLAGNNRNKMVYIEKCIAAGLNVLSDKPMALNSSDFELLKKAFADAEEKGVLLYDIMTERYEITTILQKACSEQETIFGELIQGSIEEPAITKESVHHFFKYVSGKPLQRPDWFFDVTQQGEAIADVGTHLVDLILWEAFPEGTGNYKENIQIVNSKRWATEISPEQFKKVTGLDSYPGFLEKYLDGEILKPQSNSAIDFTINGTHAKVSVEWAFEAPEGTGDTHYSIMRGTISDLIIKQGPEENFRPELYVACKERRNKEIVEANIRLYINEQLNEQYPGVAFEPAGEGVWKITVPNKYRIGHEAHFAEVTKKFLEYLENGTVPQWEIDQMIAKYYITTLAVEKAK